MARGEDNFDRRKRRLRTKLKRLTTRLRLSVHRSDRHIYAQVIDDVQGKTLAAASSLEKDLRASLKTGGDMAAAKEVGKLVASRAVAAGVTTVVFDRGGFHYHGRVAAVAEAAREAGLEF